MSTTPATSKKTLCDRKYDGIPVDSKTSERPPPGPKSGAWRTRSRTATASSTTSRRGEGSTKREQLQRPIPGVAVGLLGASFQIPWTREWLGRQANQVDPKTWSNTRDP